MKRLFALTALALAVALNGCNSDDNDIVVDSDVSLPDFVSKPRASVNINEGWTYQMDFDDIQATLSDFDDSGSEWEKINLPHSVDAGNVINADPASPHFKGMNTYRKTITINPTAGKRQYLEFDGSALQTTIYVNGEKAGEEANGFMRFRVDITDFIVDGENTLVIQVDNRPYDSTVHDTAFLPMETGQDYTYYGGIYRDLRLIEVGEVGLDAEDYGSSGVYFMQTETTQDSSNIYSNIRVRNKSDEVFEGHVRTIIKDADGKTIYTGLSKVAVDTNSVAEVESEFTLKNIHLWDGVKDPYLYRIFVEVFDGNTLVDQIEQPLGLRYFEFNADKGFLLNGQPYRLNGVAMHQDRDVVGWSTTQEMRENDLDMIRDMGATSIRFSHYPHHIDTSEYSNKVGFINYLELPIVNRYLVEGKEGEEYLASAKEQMRTLVRQNFNYPSMAIVGNSNEIGIGMPNSDANTQWLQSLSDVIKDEFGERFGKDVPYRKTTLATVLNDKIGDNDWNTVEMPCHNRYYGWYVGKIDDVGGFIDELKTEYPDLPFCMSEYGAGVSTLPEFATENPKMADHSSQWGNMYHEGHLKAFNEREWVWGTYVWNMFDFSVATRDEGDTIGRNDKGLVKFDHTTKKDQFFLYQANWSEKPMIHIVDKNLAEGTSRAVKVYSTLDEVTLVINGEKVGTKLRSDNDPLIPGVFEWNTEENGPYFVAGQQNSIQVSGVKNGKRLSDEFSKLVNEYEGTSIYSDLAAAINTGDKTGVVSHLPDNITFEGLKDIFRLDLGAVWGEELHSGKVLEGGDRFTIVAGNGDVRTYTVTETTSLSTYRDAYSSMLYQFVAPDAVDSHMFDGDLSTSAVGMIGFDVNDASGTISVDLGAVFYVDSVEPSRQGVQGIGDAAITIQIKGDVLGTDKVPHTGHIDWVDQTIALDKGPQVIRRLELYMTGTKWTVQGTVPLAGFSEINVYGGLIKGDLLGIDYKARTFKLDNSITNIEQLRAAMVKIDSESLVSDKVTVMYLDNAGQEADSLSAVSQIKVSQVRNSQTYAEVYTRS